MDFVGLWDEVPAGDELDLLREAHDATHRTHPGLRFDGFHAAPADLAVPPPDLGPLPTWFENQLHRREDGDVNWVTWHELAERPVVVLGEAPAVRTDKDALLAHTRDNLGAYWRDSQLDQVEHAGPEAVGHVDWAVEWVVLGVARLHHLLATGELTSKSGAGRYILSDLDTCWHRIAREALRLREDPSQPGLYAGHPAERGRDLTFPAVDDRGRIAGLAPGRVSSVAGGGGVADRFDVVAVGVADEGTEVALVVLGPQPRRVQRLGP